MRNRTACPGKVHRPRLMVIQDMYRECETTWAGEISTPDTMFCYIRDQHYAHSYTIQRPTLRAIADRLYPDLT